MNLLGRFRRWLERLFNDDYLLGDQDKQWRTNLTVLAMFMFAFSLLMTGVYLLRGTLQDTAMDVAGSLGLALVNLLSFILLHTLRRHRLALYLFSIGMLMYAYYLLLFGSAELYSALWILIYPLVFCLFFGNAFARPYLTWLLAAMLLIFSPLFDPWRFNEYSASFRTQLPIMFTVSSLLTMFAEYIRHRTRQRLLSMFQHYYESANQDQLTGLFNRRAFYDVIARECSRAKRHQADLQLIMCDIDRFKVINDRLGHQGGDSYLIHIAGLLKNQLRGEDYCFRWGGEEFLLLLCSTAPLGALGVAQRLRESVARTPLRD
ncbi:MAG: GGDEF domain-containing protein, partial [Oscillospiraceae bacterium]|nr:GGDEF domain-containing protein [Oscillospiraceae bacterium]